MFVPVENTYNFLDKSLFVLLSQWSTSHIWRWQQREWNIHTWRNFTACVNEKPNNNNRIRKRLHSRISVTYCYECHHPDFYDKTRRASSTGRKISYITLYSPLLCWNRWYINHMWNEYFSAYDDWLNDSLCDTMRSDDVVGEFFHVEGRVRDVRWEETGCHEALVLVETLEPLDLGQTLLKQQSRRHF